MQIQVLRMNVMMINITKMKKTIYMIVAIFTLLSCNKKDNLIVPSKSVDHFYLGQIITNEDYDKKSLEIRLSQDNLINEIIVLSDKYETAKGAKVGLTFTEVKAKHGKPLSEHLSLQKSGSYQPKKDTSKPVDVLIYEGILFFPEKNNDTVKYILVTNEKWH